MTAQTPVTSLHILVELLPVALVLQAGLGQVDRKHASDSYHACNPPIDQFGWEAVEGQVRTDISILNLVPFSITEKWTTPRCGAVTCWE